MSDTRIFNALSRTELEQKLDAFRAKGKPFEDVPLILPAQGFASRTRYGEFTVRYWRDPQTGTERYDTAVRLK